MRTRSDAKRNGTAGWQDDRKKPKSASDKKGESSGEPLGGVKRCKAIDRPGGPGARPEASASPCRDAHPGRGRPPAATHEAGLQPFGPGAPARRGEALREAARRRPAARGGRSWLPAMPTGMARPRRAGWRSLVATRQEDRCWRINRSLLGFFSSAPLQYPRP